MLKLTSLRADLPRLQAMPAAMVVVLTDIIPTFRAQGVPVARAKASLEAHMATTRVINTRLHRIMHRHTQLSPVAGGPDLVKIRTPH